MGPEGDPVPWIRGQASGLSGANGKVGLVDKETWLEQVRFLPPTRSPGVQLEANNEQMSCALVKLKLFRKPRGMSRPRRIFSFLMPSCFVIFFSIQNNYNEYSVFKTESQKCNTERIPPWYIGGAAVLHSLLTILTRDSCFPSIRRYQTFFPFFLLGEACCFPSFWIHLAVTGFVDNRWGTGCEGAELRVIRSLGRWKQCVCVIWRNLRGLPF